MIAHHCICPQRHRKHIGQLLKTILDPLPAVLERLTAVTILTAQKRTPHTA
jgi:hypothetical protein